MNEEIYSKETASAPLNSQSALPKSRSLVRTLFFVVSILFFIGVLIFLVYHNGKSIYANGL
jgi:hypothetical protein